MAPQSALSGYYGEGLQGAVRPPPRSLVPWALVAAALGAAALWALPGATSHPTAVFRAPALARPRVNSALQAQVPTFDPLGLRTAQTAPLTRFEEVTQADAPAGPAPSADETSAPAVPWPLLAAPLLIAAALSTSASGPRWGMAATSGQSGGGPGPYRTSSGEDAAAFALEQQRLEDWVKFLAVLVTVLGGLFVVWIYPPTGYADEFIRGLEGLAGNNSELTMLLILGIFGIAHSGLAGLRARGEAVIGERAYRVLFGLVSLPLALVALVYFINHRYDGTPLWDLRDVPGMHSFVWITTFISFWFLYPSTFNLLEIAAVEKPKVHMWETGIMRITRHPQMVGQLLWCIAHTLWIGNSFAVTTSAGLMAHHLFGCWHGDRRLQSKYGKAFEEVKARTSTWPFVAILEGRQQLPPDYWKEFARGPYLVITVGTIAAYFAHPLMQLGSYNLHW